MYSKYYIRITIPEYLEKFVDFEVKDTVVELGMIQMEKNINLETVTVVFKKPEFKRTLDGVSVNVDGTELQTLNTLFDVLKASPLITSPDDESIEIIGKGSPLILIDRQAIMTNEELKAIPANQVDRIEIITNPSAKYKAQGSGNGVIEVYTKDFHLEGYNMTLRLRSGINTQGMPTAGLNAGISVKKKKFTLSGYFGGNYSKDNYYGTTNGYTTDDSQIDMGMNYDGINQNTWEYYNIKGAYKINNAQKITMGVNGYGSAGGGYNDQVSIYRQYGDTTTSKISTSNSTYTWLNNNAFVNYTIETDTNHSALEINLNYTNKISNSTDESFSNLRDYSTGILNEYDIKTESKDQPHVGELRVVYEHIFDTTGWKLSVGGAYSLLLNGKRYYQYGLDGEEWVENSIYTNSYDYREDIGAFFVEATKSWKKVSARVGVRTEYTKLDGYSHSLNQQFMDSTYLLPFPTASVMYQPNEKIGFTLAYNSGIDRPQFSNYDPFVRIDDSLSVSYGNPYLRPAIDQNVELNINFLYAYNFSVSYSVTKDPSSEYSFIDENTLIRETTPWNATSTQTYGGQLSAPIQTKWMSGWNSIWMNFNQYEFPTIFNREPFSNLTYGLSSYMSFNLPKNYKLSNHVRLSKWGSDNSTGNSRFNWGLRVSKRFDNDFSLYLGLEDIIPPRVKSSEYSGNYYYELNNQQQFTRLIFGCSFKFGRLKSNTQIEESSSGQSDRL